MNNMSHTTNSFIFVCFFIPPLCMGRLILARILILVECCLCHHFCVLWFVFVWFLLTLAFCLDVDVRICWVPIVRALICELSSGGCAAEDGD